MQKTVALTGATIPASMLGSDAAFSVGYALGASAALAQHNHYGVYLCLHGEVLECIKCVQNEHTGFFEATPTI
jgi:hypothetical protein